MTVLEVAVELEPGVGGRDEDADDNGVREERLAEDVILRGRLERGTAVCVDVVEWEEVDGDGDGERGFGAGADDEEEYADG